MAEQKEPPNALAPCTNDTWQFKLSNELFQMQAGPLAMAVGAEYRKDKLTQDYNPVLQTGDVSGYGGNFLNVNADRDDTALFAEFNIPLLKTLEANVAIRTDNYSDFGRTNNPKATLRWQPNRDVLLRASYGTAFLAPSLYQLFVPNTQGVSATGLSDPVRCPVTNDTGIDCNTQFPVVFGGNTELKPEESENVTFGLASPILLSRLCVQAVDDARVARDHQPVGSDDACDHSAHLILVIRRAAG